MAFAFRPLNEADAEQVIAWRYAPPYEVYNLSPADRAVLLDPRNAYFAADDEDGQLIGFCCFGPEARVPGGSYGEDTGLDIGVGLRPDATGQGLGPKLIRNALDLGRRIYGAHRFGVTVAAFNERAVRAAQRAGFTRTGRFIQTESRREWVQLLAQIP